MNLIAVMDFFVEWMSTRTVLWYVTFCGFAVNYMVRINMNIAIVAMVQPRNSRPGQLQSECFVQNLSNSEQNTSNAGDNATAGVVQVRIQKHHSIDIHIPRYT